MRKVLDTVVPVLAVVVAVVMTTRQCGRGEGTSQGEVTVKTDTVYVTLRDTVKVRDTVYVDRHIVDTIYMMTVDSIIVGVPSEQRHYGGDGRYDLWISGIMPSMDSLNIYMDSKTVYIERDRMVKKKEGLQLYAGIGIGYCDRVVMPELSLMMKTGRGDIFGGRVGYCDMGLTYGISYHRIIKLKR